MLPPIGPEDGGFWGAEEKYWDQGKEESNNNAVEYGR